MLKQKCANNDRQGEPTAIDGGAQCYANQGRRGGVCFQCPFDVPFGIQFLQASRDRRRAGLF